MVCFQGFSSKSSRRLWQSPSYLLSQTWWNLEWIWVGVHTSEKPLLNQKWVPCRFTERVWREMETFNKAVLKGSSCMKLTLRAVAQRQRHVRSSPYLESHSISTDKEEREWCRTGVIPRIWQEEGKPGQIRTVTISLVTAPEDISSQFLLSNLCKSI